MGVSARKGITICCIDKMFAGVFAQHVQSNNKYGNFTDWNYLYAGTKGEYIFKPFV